MAENFVSGLEFAVGLDQGWAAKIERAEATVDDVGLEDGATLAEKCVTQAFAVCEVRGGKCLEGFSVAYGNEIRFSNVRNDRDVRGDIEVDGKRDEFVKRKKIFGFHKWYMKNENDCLVFQVVDERCFQFLEVGGLMNEIVEFVCCCHVLDVVYNGL